MEDQAYAFQATATGTTGFAAATSAGTTVTMGRLEASFAGKLQSWRIVNATTGQLTFVASLTKTTADNVAVPTTTAKPDTYVMLASSVETFMLPAGFYFNCLSGTAGNVYLMPGDGV